MRSISLISTFALLILSCSKNSSSSEMTDIKLSRTQRAINAKDERYKKIETKNGSEKQKGFTSDGIEALRPFQSNIGEEESHSS